jgi:hypothetical protein
MKYQTVVTLHNLDLPAGTTIAFEDGIQFGDMPARIRSDKEWIPKYYGSREQERIAETKHALVSEYECEALYEQDKRWAGRGIKHKQQVQYELCALANLSLWLVRPSPACVGFVFHSREEKITAWNIQASSSALKILCHPNDVEARLSPDDVAHAAVLHKAIVGEYFRSAPWPPATIALSFLQMNSELVRYLLCWVGLESLFGPDDGRELSFRLAQRIGFFRGKDKQEGRAVFETARDGYNLRSKLAHGRWKYDVKTTQLMALSEDLIRRAFIRILENPELLETFAGKKREEYLDSLVYS